MRRRLTRSRGVLLHQRVLPMPAAGLPTARTPKGSRVLEQGRGHPATFCGRVIFNRMAPLTKLTINAVPP